MLMHISSLPSRYSIGSLGKNAYRFVDFLKEAGFGYWQVLPLCLTDTYGSPYKSRASFSLNPWFLDTEKLYNEGLLSKSELRLAEEKTPYLVEYDRLNNERIKLLYRAAMRVENREKIADFVNKELHLSQTIRFLALADSFKGIQWRKWNSSFEPDSDILFFWQFVHYEFLHEWMALKSYANERGVEIIGDIPMYADYDSADVWMSPESFLLDKNRLPYEVAGVPPDYFSADGQLWGNPLYNWRYMSRSGFEFWRGKLTFALKMYDAVRIDHFRAFDSYYAIPKGSKDTRAGKWKRGPGRKFVDELNKWRGEKTVIAEDLGDQTDTVRSLLSYAKIPGMRVVQFGAPCGVNSVHLPHAWDENVFAYTGTHDNNTLLGAIYEMNAQDRELLFEYFGIRHNDFSLAVTDIIQGMLASRARAVIIPVQDLLIFGSDTRMNTPGVAAGNWRYRITEDNLSQLLQNSGKWKNINSLYDRQ